MNRVVLVLSLVATACGPTAPPPPAPTIKLAEGTSSLDATINKVKVGKGSVWCSLHISGEGFPGASPIIGGSAEVTANSTSVKCVYSGLPAGTYAISVIQDENSNGTLDLSAFGAPTEGYGASRNNLPAAAAPTFEDNKVTLADGEQATLDITLR